MDTTTTGFDFTTIIIGVIILAILSSLFGFNIPFLGSIFGG